MAFTWTNTPTAGGKIKAAEVNEVRDLLNTMYDSLQCSARQAVVYASHNEGHKATKYDSKNACNTVYSARYNSYCASVNGAKVVNSYANNAIAATCPNNNSSQCSNNTCTQNDTSDRTSYNNQYRQSHQGDDYVTDNESQCGSDYGSEYDDFDFCGGYDGSCSSNWDYQFGSERNTNESWDYGTDHSGDDDWYYTSDFNNDHGSNWNTQHSGNYGSKKLCTSKESTYYNGRQTSQNSTVHTSKYICNTQHGAYGT